MEVATLHKPTVNKCPFCQGDSPTDMSTYMSRQQLKNALYPKKVKKMSKKKREKPRKIKQYWLCERCKTFGMVEMRSDEWVTAGLRKIDKSHQAKSPECKSNRGFIRTPDPNIYEDLTKFCMDYLDDSIPEFVATIINTKVSIWDEHRANKEKRTVLKINEKILDEWAEKQGYHFKIIHVRKKDYEGKLETEINNTFMMYADFISIERYQKVDDELVIGDGTVVDMQIGGQGGIYGIAKCSPKDNFDRLFGRFVGKIRAINNHIRIMRERQG